MLKLLNYLLGILAASLGLALILVLNIFLIPVFGYGMIAIDLLYAIAGLVLISYLAEISVPGLRILLRRAYYRTKFRIDECKKSKKEPGAGSLAYLKFLAVLIMLFKSAEEGFEVIKEEAHEIYSKAVLFVEKKEKSSPGKAAHKHLFEIHKAKQRRAATISAGTLILLVIGSVITGLLSSLIFPAIFQSRAATFTWTQTKWTASSTDVAQHPTHQTGWMEYSEKDDNIELINYDTDGFQDITMSSGSQNLVDDTNEDFSQGFFINNSLTMGFVEDGKVKISFGYDASGICSGFGEAHYEDDSTSATWDEAKILCNNLCVGCNLPTSEELICICENHNSFGGNFVENADYWSSSAYNSEHVYFVEFDHGYSPCDRPTGDPYNERRVRCVRN